MTAAERIRAALKAADEGNYPRSALFYVSRSDVETVLDQLEGQVDAPLKLRADGREIPPEYLPYEDIGLVRR